MGHVGSGFPCASECPRTVPQALLELDLLHHSMIPEGLHLELILNDNPPI